MSVSKPVPVPQKEITSIDLVGWSAGLNLNGPQDAPNNSFIDSKDVELSIDGFMVPRRVLTPFLPDAVGTIYHVLPVLWEGNIYYFTADNNEIKFCQEGDTSWTACGGTNTIVTGNGGKPKFLRILDKVLMFNGTNGDKLCYVDLSTSGFPVVKYALVTDPPDPLTVAATNLTITGSQPFNIYYAFSYSGAVGETLLSPILTVPLNLSRDQWAVDTAAPSELTLTRPGSAPAGAQFWNLYVALAATGGAIQDTDMLQVATGLDLNSNTFIDNGTSDIDLGSLAPVANYTDGPRVDHGVEEDGNPILFGDVDNPQSIWIGGGGIYALDFSVSDNGYLAQPEQGTNFSPTAIVGFRNGLGQPSITILYSNTEGLSKQSVIEQDTVTYGGTSFSVWGVKEQHYGAAGVAASDSVINYNGKLQFFSTDGIMQMNTQPLRQNVIATASISIKQIDSYIRAVKNSAMGNIIGAAWDNKFMWTVPNNGFDTPQQILVCDDNNKSADDFGAWYTLDIPAQWIGVVSPQTQEAFVYVCQGNKTFKLVKGNTTADSKGGIPVPFSTSATGPLIGFGGQSHNQWQADVQVMFYIAELVGDITVGVNYRDQSGKMKTKTKTYHGPVYEPSGAGGWGDTGWSYAEMPDYAGTPPLDGGSVAPVAVDVRIPVQVDDIMNEAQWFYSTPVGYGSYRVRAISFEGVELGVRPDLQ